MLIVRAPVRISFGGGGTDLAAYAERYGGLVLSAAITRYCYVVVSRGEADGIQVSSADLGRFSRRPAPPGSPAAEADDALRLPWAVLRHCGLERGLHVFLASEVPPGTGLGSSSTLTVALLQALLAWRGAAASRAALAEQAAQIEIDQLGMPIGRQDQYAAAFGGLNLIRFGPAQGAAQVERLALDRAARARLERHLLLFFTGVTRRSDSILREQRAATLADQASVLTALHTIKALALEMRACLERDDLAGFGQLLDQGWQHKKGLAGGITTPAIDAAYATAQAHGAWGGKITGAGGGGFLLLCCPPERQAAVTQALHAHGLQRMAFRFANRGATVLLHDTTMTDDETVEKGASYPAALFMNPGLRPPQRNGTGVMHVGKET